MEETERTCGRLLDELQRLADVLSRRRPRLDALQRRDLRRLLDRIDGLAGNTACEAPERLPAAAVPPEIIGESAALRKVLGTVRRVGPRGSNVLIEGESGTGKELVARAVHAAGPRRDGPFIPVDCGSLPDTLLESELFGHRKGAFTGASGDRTGLFEEASGGSLFLDEIANASPSFQTRLLRALQEKEIRRVGENQVRRLDLRVIAATGGELERMVREGSFRGDLYYRLHVVGIALPPLRERRDDIPVLVEHFLPRLCLRHGLPPKVLSPGALDILMRYRWPGNVRELENVIERAVLLGSGGVLQPDALPTSLLDALLHQPGPTGAPVRAPGAKSGEQRLIERTLLETRGAKVRAARLIGWHRNTLYRKMRRYGISVDFGRGEGGSH